MYVHHKPVLKINMNMFHVLVDRELNAMDLGFECSELQCCCYICMQMEKVVVHNPTHKEIAREKKDDMILSEYIKIHGARGWRSHSKKVSEPLSLLLER